MSRQKGGAKADTLVKVILVFFISLLSFSVGTFVGKQVSDSDHRRLALEGEYKADRSVASEGEATPAHPGKITDEEVASLTEEFVNKEKEVAADQEEPAEDAHHADTASPPGDHAAPAPEYKKWARPAPKADPHTKPEPPASPEHKAEAPHKPAPKEAEHTPKPEPTADNTHQVANKIAKGEAPTDGATEERKPAATLPAVASTTVGKFTVQVASYATEAEAKNHASDLKGKGWNSFYLAAPVQGRTWYRVMVGLFANHGKATEFRAQFMKEAGTKSAIVQKIVQ